MIYKLNAGSSATILDNDGPATFHGYQITSASGGGNVNISFNVDNGGVGVSGGVAVPDGFVIISCGMNGASALTKMNKNAGITSAGRFVTTSGKPASLGISNSVSSPLLGTLIEICAWVVAPTQAMILSIHQSITG
jgi:hypothetical protein